ncbi:MAG: rRNA adenine dimethyltransferase family protein [Bacteroidota bacterium]|nr:rRNA adenine dimethyltransferase family protein [Bacteroidota bacterium]
MDIKVEHAHGNSKTRIVGDFVHCFMRAAPYFPKKSLGQHFLHDGNIARNIVAALDPLPGETVLEIGPGPGVLTQLLAERDCRVIAAEIDPRAIAALHARFPTNQYPNIRFIEGDILQLDLRELVRRTSDAVTPDAPVTDAVTPDAPVTDAVTPDAPVTDAVMTTGLAVDGFAPASMQLRVLGNLPYNITSQILFHLFDQHGTVRDAVMMMQREVAARILAPPGGKEYGILSVMVGTHCAVRRCFHVSPNVFTPKPKVWSTVLHFEFQDQVLAKIRNYSFFRRLVKATFGQRRKTLSNSLRQLEPDIAGVSREAKEFLSRRPEQLSIEEFITLANILAPNIPNTSDHFHGSHDGIREA